MLSMQNIYDQAIQTIETYAAIKNISRKSTLEASPRFAITCHEIAEIANKNDAENFFFSVNPEEGSLVIQMQMFELYTKNGRTDTFFNVIKEVSSFVVRKVDDETICLELNFPFQWV